MKYQLCKHFVVWSVLYIHITHTKEINTTSDTGMRNGELYKFSSCHESDKGVSITATWNLLKVGN